MHPISSEVIEHLTAPPSAWRYFISKYAVACHDAAVAPAGKAPSAAMQALNEGASKEPNNPVGYYTIAAYYWEKAYRDFRLKKEDKLKYIDLGLEAADKALQLQPDYMDAIKSKELLYRAEALNISDQAKIQQLLKDAGQLSDKYNELRKKKAGGL